MKEEFWNETESCGQMESCGQGKDYRKETVGEVWSFRKDAGLEREVGNYREIELCGKHWGLHGEGGRMEKQGIIGNMGQLVGNPDSSQRCSLYFELKLSSGIIHKILSLGTVATV